MTEVNFHPVPDCVQTDSPVQPLHICREGELRLTDDVLTRVRQAGVTVYFADRRLTKLWNKDRSGGDPAHFGGWYWHRSRGRQIIDMDTSGPFKTQSAAVRDAYIRLQLRHAKKD